MPATNNFPQIIYWEPSTYPQESKTAPAYQKNASHMFPHVCRKILALNSTKMEACIETNNHSIKNTSYKRIRNHWPPKQTLNALN